MERRKNGVAHRGDLYLDFLTKTLMPEVEKRYRITARATAGSSLGLLAMLGGFEADNVTIAPLVEPLLINPAQIFVVSFALPAAGATVDETVHVPNNPALVGATVWLQALQFAGNAIHLSTVVGGTIR